MRYLYFDCETYYDTKQKFDLRNVSIVEYVRDPRFKLQGFAFALDDGPIEWSTDLASLKRTIDWTNTAVVAHNAKFDGFILAENWINPKLWICTKAMAKAVLGKTIKGHSLRELADHFGLEPKGELKTDGLAELSEADEAQLAEYCKHDVKLDREIFKRLQKEFPENQYEVMDWTIRTFVNPKLKLNVPLLEKANEAEKERRKTIFTSIGIPKEIFSSNQKFTELLQSRGYEVPYKKSPRTGKSIPALALGDPEFLDLAHSEDLVLKELCEARIAAKSTLLETRSAKLARIGRTGAWPFDVEFSGATQTHRFSGGSGAGGNPQNFTKGSVLREAVEAPTGFKLVIGDFANIELRLAAYLSKDPGLIQALEQDCDLYCDFASAFYGRTITKEDKTERKFGKTALLGLGYGMGPAKFRKTVRLQTGQPMSQDEAERAVSLYRAKYLKVPAKWDQLHREIEDLQETFTDTLPSGLTIRYPNLRREEKEWVFDVWKKKTEKESVKLYGGKRLENICQALAGELCKEALIRVKEWAVGQVHDELLLCVPNGLVAVAAARLKVAMETPPSWLPELNLKAEIKIGQNWSVK